jgi:hypothetical protein
VLLQQILVVLVVLTSAAYATARLLPGALVERLLRRIDTAGPQVSGAARRFAGRPLSRTAAAPDGCTTCVAAKDHEPRRP